MENSPSWTAPTAAILAILATLAMVLLAQGCGSGAQGTPHGGSSSGSSSTSSSGASGSSSTSSSGASGSSSTSSSGASGSSSTSSSGSSGTSSGATPECAGQRFDGKRQPLDIYVMLDRSGSMADYTGFDQASKWEAVTAALSSFVRQPLEGTSVGLQYFGLPAASCGSQSCTRDPDCDACGGLCVAGRCRSNSRDADSCNAADYARPEVEIGPLATTASLITASMDAQEPTRSTPTSAALQGAVDHARAWASAAQNAGHAVLVVLATDGDPTECDTDLDHINAIAAAGLSASPSVRTFVIGVGDLKANLDGIAKAGGTGAAYIVSTGSSVTDQFLKALNDIRGKTVGCSYAIPAAPAGQKLDFRLVNVEYQPGTGGPKVTLGKVANAASCGASPHAWHYDDATPPTSIVLCPSTCSTVEADATARVKIVLGCETSEF